MSVTRGKMQLYEIISSYAGTSGPACLSVFIALKQVIFFLGFFRLPRRFPATADLNADQARRGVLPGAAMLINQGILTKGEGSVQLTSSLR